MSKYLKHIEEQVEKAHSDLKNIILYNKIDTHLVPLLNSLEAPVKSLVLKTMNDPDLLRVIVSHPDYKFDK